MKRSEYEQRRQALEDAFETELATLRAAHQIRLRSLEALWLANPEEDAPPQVPVVPPIPVARRRMLSEVVVAVEDVLPHLPEVFDKNDVVRLLEWSPPRATLFRALDALVSKGRLTIERSSMGRVSNVYRQTALRSEA